MFLTGGEAICEWFSSTPYPFRLAGHAGSLCYPIQVGHAPPAHLGGLVKW
jgi:hypothetical protein